MRCSSTLRWKLSTDSWRAGRTHVYVIQLLLLLLSVRRANFGSTVTRPPHRLAMHSLKTFCCRCQNAHTQKKNTRTHSLYGKQCFRFSCASVCFSSRFDGGSELILKLCLRMLVCAFCARCLCVFVCMCVCVSRVGQLLGSVRLTHTQRSVNTAKPLIWQGYAAILSSTTNDDDCAPSTVPIWPAIATHTRAHTRTHTHIHTHTRARAQTPKREQ